MVDNSSKQQKEGPVYRFVLFSQMVIRNFTRDNCFILASSVVYSTLISAIPFLAFIIAMLTAFGAFNIAQEVFLEFFAEQFGTDAGQGMIEMLDGFIENAGNLGVVGLVSFLITSVILINRVWVTINQIYHTSMNRNQVARFAQFITVLIVSTLLLSAYFSVNALMSKFLSQFFAFGLFMQILGLIGPWVIIFLVFFLLIFAIPNTKVKWSSAAIGAAVGTLAFQMANTLFNNVVLKVLNYSLIYGSLATLLIGLIWMYLWWVIIFGAVEIAYVHQYRPDEKRHKGLVHPPAEQIAYGFDILHALSVHFKEGRGAMSMRDLGLKLKIPDRALYTYLELLEQEGFIIRMERSGRHFIPARPLDDLRIVDAARIIYGEQKKRSGLSAGERLSEEMLKLGISKMGSRSINDLGGL